MGLAQFLRKESRAKLAIAASALVLLCALGVGVYLRNSPAYHDRVNAEIGAAQTVCVNVAPVARELRARSGARDVRLDRDVLGDAAPPLRHVDPPEIRRIQSAYGAAGRVFDLFCVVEDPRGRTVHGPAVYYYSYTERAWVPPPIGAKGVWGE